MCVFVCVCACVCVCMCVCTCAKKKAHVGKKNETKKQGKKIEMRRLRPQKIKKKQLFWCIKYASWCMRFRCVRQCRLMQARRFLHTHLSWALACRLAPSLLTRFLHANLETGPFAHASYTLLTRFSHASYTLSLYLIAQPIYVVYNDVLGVRPWPWRIRYVACPKRKSLLRPYDKARWRLI